MIVVSSDDPENRRDPDLLDAVPAPDSAVTLAHVSDPHIACVNDIKPSELLSKRLLGYLKWILHRRTRHSDDILWALVDDLKKTRPDHIAVTGDLTHLSLPAEFQKARQWLQSLGSPAQVTVIPGNHDAYVRINWHQTYARWIDYMRSDKLPPQADALIGFNSVFPSVRIRGCMALIGICTANPSPPFLAVGSMGAEQLQKLEQILVQTSRDHLFRILLIHHPPAPRSVSWHKRLTDAEPLRAIISRHGAELILHGHAHRTVQKNLNARTARVRVIGVPSASALVRKQPKRARYYIYRIWPNPDRWSIQLSARIYSPDKHRFTAEKEWRFTMPQLPNPNRIRSSQTYD